MRIKIKFYNYLQLQVNSLKGEAGFFGLKQNMDLANLYVKV